MNNTVSQGKGGGRKRIPWLDGRAFNKGNPGNKGGRPPGSLNRLSQAAREAAARTGLLPHEILLSMARGEPVRIVKVLPTGDHVETYQEIDVDTAKDAAKAAAPYYAPKMSTVELLSGVSDGDLNELIKSAAAEAGVDLAIGGGSETEPDQEA
jgi:hypothetical protein